MLDGVVRVARLYRQFAMTETKNRFNFDEVSVLFRDENHLRSLVAEAKRRDLWFNCSKEKQIDLVTLETYTTNYQFIWPDEESGWRIEAMHVVFGNAPLHERLMEVKGKVCIAHVSFKLKTMEQYKEAKASLRFRHGYEMAAEYENSYGQFSYFPMYDEDDRLLVYLKPRINLRDQRKKEENNEEDDRVWSTEI